MSIREHEAGFCSQQKELGQLRNVDIAFYIQNPMPPTIADEVNPVWSDEITRATIFLSTASLLVVFEDTEFAIGQVNV